MCVCVCVCAQSCPALCDPMDCSPPGSSVHGILQGCVCVFALSHVRLFVTLWTAVHQAPLSMGFSRQQHWNELPFPSSGDLPNPGIEPRSLLSCRQSHQGSHTFNLSSAVKVEAPPQFFFSSNTAITHIRFLDFSPTVD